MKAHENKDLENLGEGNPKPENTIPGEGVGEPKGKQDPIPDATFRVKPSKLNVRNKPSKDGEILCVLNKGETLKIKTPKDGWARVYTAADIKGFVMVQFLEEV